MKSCLGCGSLLQTTNKFEQGYVNDSEHAYCLRCFKIKNYNQLVDSEINDKQFINKISTLVKNNKNNNLVFYYVLDIFDLFGSRILEIENLIKDFKVILVVNKIDLLPKSVKLEKIRNYINNIFKNSSLKNVEIFLTSANKINLVEPLLNKVIKNNKNQQYFIGASNVGKSSLINKMLEINQLIPSIVVSKFFNTTLDFIEIQLDKNTTIFDSAGVSRKNSIANLMNKRFQSYCYFKKEIQQFTYQLTNNNSIFFSGLCWFDYISLNNQKTSFHIYTNKEINLHRTNTKNVIRYWNNNRKNLIPYISNSDQIQVYEFKFDKSHLNNWYDISISGLGWINFKVESEMIIKINIPSDQKTVLVSLNEPLI
ncbi:ribosome biogenesis GTPase YqeH [Mycoplasma capricolum subsp. capricolum]|uniref:ribosome biogenesis GTPase YqeH n=1 Tax=Mycoplasma capricolum TaxID=2095 RepID=UPI003DA689FC